MKKSLGKRIAESLQEVVDTLKKGIPLEDKFVITRVIKQDDETYKFIRSKPKKWGIQPASVEKTQQQEQIWESIWEVLALPKSVGQAKMVGQDLVGIYTT